MKASRHTINITGPGGLVITIRYSYEPPQVQHPYPTIPATIEMLGVAQHGFEDYGSLWLEEHQELAELHARQQRAEKIV